MAPPEDRSWWHRIVEPYTGAWQQNVEIKVDAVLSYSTVYACISLISADISKLRLRLMQLEDGIWVETDSPAFSPVLRKPNNYQNRAQFIKHWVTTKLIHGNAYILKERDNRQVVVGLYVLDPRRVRVLIAPNGDVFYELQSDELAGIDSQYVVVPSSEIIHDRMNTLHHPLVGIGPIYASGLAATQGLKIQNTSATFFGNGAQPGGVLTAPSEIKPETAQRLKEHWENNYSGRNAGKIAVLGDGLKYEAIMMSAHEAQLIDQLKLTAETVASTFHVPPYMVGAGPMPSYNNIDALMTQYYSQCLQELIENIELCLDEGLKLPPGLGTEFDIDDLIRMDTAAMVKANADAVGAGIKTPNEARRQFSLPPVKGGDTTYLQEQNYSLSALDERDRNNPFAEPPPPAAEPVAEPEVQLMISASVQKLEVGELWR
jgi:HK97 family phage portal protein